MKPLENLVMPVVKVGLIGSNIARSLTPAMHMREGAEAGLDYQYQIIDLAEHGRSANDLERLIREAELDGFAGLNITHPCKQAAVALVDELSSHARSLQSINTIVFKNGRRIGHNTDWWGFAESFKYNFSNASLENVVLLGAGGAGVAVAYALAEMGAKNITVFDIDESKVISLLEKLKVSHPLCQLHQGVNLSDALASACGLVNATPVGMDAHPGLPVDAAMIDKHLWVSDIIYFPLQTELMLLARQRGCQVLTGGGMAVFQAIGAFELFSGSKASTIRMLDHFNQLQAERR